MKNLPCPFCGNLNQETYDLYYNGLHRLIYCKCGAQGSHAANKEGAITAWNTRITGQALEKN